MLAKEFHFATDGRIIGAPPTLLQRFFLNSWPYCYFVLLSPIVGVAALCFTREKPIALLLLLHLVIILSVTFTFSVAPSLRYLQPASVLCLLAVALCLQARWSSGLREEPARIFVMKAFVTGGAGFIGSHLVRPAVEIREN